MRKIEERTDCKYYVPPEPHKKTCCRVLNSLVCRQKKCTFFTEKQEDKEPVGNERKQSIWENMQQIQMYQVSCQGLK